jgi:hypothetical protein
MRSVCIALLLASAPGCGRKDNAGDVRPELTANQEHFSSRGKLVGIKDKMVDIHHEAMPSVRGFDGTLGPMMSMRMSFAAPPAGVGAVAIGDVVAFEFTVHYDAEPTLRLTRIDKLPADTRLVLE